MQIASKGEDSKKGRLMRMATYASVSTALIIAAMKLMAWVATDSLSLLSSLVDSLLDVLASLMGMAAVRYALKPADEDHRFGHGKAEDIAAFAQSAFVGGSGIFIAIEGIRRLINPREIENTELGIKVMVASMVLTLCLVLFQRFVIRRTGSGVIQADSLHYATDVAVNLVVIISLVGVRVFDTNIIDPICALLIAVYILSSAFKIASRAFDHLMDKEFSEEERQRIIALVLAHPDVKAMHDLRTRRSGLHTFIQFHMELDGAMTLKQAHRVSEQVERSVKQAFPESDVLVHQDPVGGEKVPLEAGHVLSIDR